MIFVSLCKLFILFNNFFFGTAVKLEIDSDCVFGEEAVIERFDEISLGNSL